MKTHIIPSLIALSLGLTGCVYSGTPGGYSSGYSSGGYGSGGYYAEPAPAPVYAAPPAYYDGGPTVVIGVGGGHDDDHGGGYGGDHGGGYGGGYAGDHGGGQGHQNGGGQQGSWQHPQDNGGQAQQAEQGGWQHQQDNGGGGQAHQQGGGQMQQAPQHVQDNNGGPSGGHPQPQAVMPGDSQWPQPGSAQHKP